MGAVLLLILFAAGWYWIPKARQELQRRRAWRAIERRKQR